MNSNSPAEREFDVDGQRYSLDAMLAANKDDPEFCAWARTAQPGGFFRGIVTCQCLQPGDLSEHDLIEIDLAYARAKVDGSLQRACDHRAMVREAQALRHDPLYRNVW